MFFEISGPNLQFERKKIVNKEIQMKTIVLILGLVVFSLTSAPAFAGSCGGGDHTHPTDSSTKTKGTGT